MTRINNRGNRGVTIVACLVALLIDSSIARANETPKLLRLAVIDNSGSMAGERIASVRDELTKVARQLPPSPSHPIVLIKFGATAAPPVLFTELAPFEAAVDLLRGDSGGTNIAAGLDEGVLQLNRLKSAQDVWILLYSDGEDPNQIAIAKAEERLDAVFADRQQHQLPQTVFCKRWGNSNAELLKLFRQRGRANVIDAGQLQVKPLTFTPAIEVTSVSWNRQTPNQLDITFAARVDVQGDIAGVTFPEMTATCRADKAEGDIDTEVTPGAAAIAGRTLHLPIAPTDRKAGEIRLSFDFSPPGEIPSDDTKYLRQLATSRVDVPVKLPQDKYTYRVLSELKPETGTWVDTVARRIRYPAKLKLTVTCLEGVEGTPGDIELVPDAGTVLISGSPVIKLAGSGTVETELVVETELQHGDKPREEWSCSFGFTGRPVNTPPNLTFETSTWAIQTAAPVPAPLMTTITGTIRNVSTPEWTNLAQGVARCDVDTEFVVQGSIAPNTVLNLLTTGSVIDLKMTPNLLHTGTQQIRLTLTAALRPRPQSMSFETSILVPRGGGVIAYQAGPPLKFSVTGPSPVPLSLAKRGRPVKELFTSIADNDRVVRLPIEPIVVGFNRSQIGDLDVILKPHTTSLGFPNSQVYHVPRAQTVNVSVASPDHRPFFRDIALTGTLDVEPAHANSAVTATTVPIRITIAAPFKRLILYLAVALSALITGVVTTRMYLALRRSD